MKTLTKKQIAKIAKILLTTKGVANNKYVGKLEAFFNAEKVREWDLGNKSRSPRILDWVSELSEVVEICGYKIESSNDAPRGGRCGDYVRKSGRKVPFNESEFFKMIETSVK